MLKKLAIGCGAFIALSFILLVLGIIGLGVAIERGYLPDATALAKGKIHPRYVESLRSANIIDADEEIQYIYMGGLTSVLEDGNLFTDKRVISYERFDGELTINQATYPEIESLEYRQGESWIDDSVITVTKTDGDWFVLLVSTDSNGDVSFYDKLRTTWEAKSGQVTRE